MIIGCYDYTVIMTYAGLICALLGMFQVIQGNEMTALLFLGGCLFCDTLDGKIARAKKNRTKREKLFGMQIDSLCDLVSFGAFPGVLCYCLGLREWYSLVIIGYYCLCCVIRLGYFNVMELEKEDGTATVYHGLPVVGLAVLMPAAFATRLWLTDEAFAWVLRVLLPVVGTLYILDFRMGKPKMWMLVLLSIFFWVPVGLLFWMM